MASAVLQEQGVPALDAHRAPGSGMHLALVAAPEVALVALSVVKEGVSVALSTHDPVGRVVEGAGVAVVKVARDALIIIEVERRVTPQAHGPLCFAQGARVAAPDGADAVLVRDQVVLGRDDVLGGLVVVGAGVVAGVVVIVCIVIGGVAATA